ncbi:MAG: hypothetical protein ACXWUE_12865 [Polyangiales bacterium]
MMSRISTDHFMHALAVAEARATERRRRIALGAIGVVVLVLLAVWVLHRNREPVEPAHVLPRVGQVELDTRGARVAAVLQPTGQPTRGVLLARPWA